MPVNQIIRQTAAQTVNFAPNQNVKSSPTLIQAKSQKMFEPIISATAFQERQGVSNTMRSQLMGRVFTLPGLGGKQLSGMKNSPTFTPPAPPTYPNAPLFSEGTRESDDNLRATTSKGKPIKDGNTVHYNDVKQGTFADCYLMSPLASIARTNPQAIKNMVSENRDANGRTTSYDVTLHQKDGDKFKAVKVNVKASEVMTDGANQADNGELWVKVVEAAYSKLNGGADNIKNGGSHTAAFEALTGRQTANHAPDGKKYSFEQMQKDFAANKNITINARSEDEGKKKIKDNTYGIHGWHTYMIEKVYTDPTGKKMVQLYNPWGNDHPKPVPFEELNKYFNSIAVN